jgi:hypothetical protein
VKTGLVASGDATAGTKLPGTGGGPIEPGGAMTLGRRTGLGANGMTGGLTGTDGVSDAG